MAGKNYAGDITGEQFELTRPILESARKVEKPEIIDLYDIPGASVQIAKRNEPTHLL